MFSSFMILAFGFASPLMLWGLAAGGVPVMIHLLHRRRFRTEQWAAMRFLLAATKKQSRRMKLEQILLLIVRTMIVLFVALALSRPSAATLGEFLQSEGPKHRIVVIDATFSMGYGPDGHSRFARAKDVARKIVGSARQGDAINLVRISDSTPRVIVRRPAFQSAAVIDEIDQLVLNDERVDASIVLKEVGELLSLSPEITRKEISFVTDLQSATWAPGDSAEAVRVRQELKRLSERAKIVWVDVGETTAANVAVTSLRFDDQFALSGRPVRISATIKNFHSVGASGQLVELLIDGRLTDTRRIDLPAEQDVAVDFAPSFSRGEHRVEVRVANDALAVDDVRRLSIPVRDELQVLLVNGKPSGEPMGNATDFLKLALSPDLPNRAFASPMRPTVIRESELLGTDLSRFDCVFVCNVALFTEREAEVLRSYLDAGGAVVFCLGDQVQPENYNRILHREKQPLLPCTLGQRIGDAKKKEVSFEFDAGDFSHPIVRPFQGNTGAGLELTKTFVYIQVHPDDNRGANVALRFGSGDPAIVEAPSGKGRVILIATSVDREWSTWAVWGHTLIPLIHETVNYSIAGRWKDRDVLVGQPLQSHVGLRAADTSAVHQFPNGDSRPMPPAAEGRSLISEPTTTSGFHGVILGPPANRTEWFAVNVDPVESDLTALGVEDLRTEILPGTDFRFLTEWEESSAEGTGSVRAHSTGTPFSKALLIAALALLFVEQMMAWQFMAGFSLMMAMILGVFVWNLWNIHPLAGACMACVIAICIATFAIGFRPALFRTSS